MNSTQWLVLSVVSPFVLLFGVRIFGLILEIVNDIFPPARTTYVKVPVERVVYRDRVRVEYRDRPAKTEKPKKKQPQNQDSQFKRDVIVGLANLGLTKKDAKTLVNSACSKKQYKTADALFQDCMVLMSEMRT